MKFEYIMSALGGMCGFNEHTELVRDIINDYLKDRPNDFGMLFNAMTEAKEGVKYYNKYNYKNLLSDSGGLQITTLGLSSEEIKKKHKEIYDIQSKYSTIAMCFDEMPIKLSHKIEGTQARLDVSNRYFIKDLVQDAALKTADNIKEQIQVFQKNNSSTKIMLICQGNDLETYKEYAETVFNNLTEQEQSHIYGLAPAGACNGTGTLDRFDMLYAIKELDIPHNIKKNIHLLGVGSFTGLLPLVASPDYFSFIENLSFDSSSAPRKYCIDGQGIGQDQFGKEQPIEIVKQQYMRIIKYYMKYFKQVQGWNIESFLENSTYYSSKNVKKVWIYRNRECNIHNSLALLLWFFVPAWKYEQVMLNIEKCKSIDFNYLKEITTYDEYIAFRKDIIRAYGLTSNKVQAVQSEEEMNKSFEMKNLLGSLF